MCSSILCEDEYLDGELRKGEIEKCVCSLRIYSLGGSKKRFLDTHLKLVMRQLEGTCV